MNIGCISAAPLVHILLILFRQNLRYPKKSFKESFHVYI